MNLINGMVAPDVETGCIVVQAEIVVDQQCSFVKEHVMVWA